MSEIVMSTYISCACNATGHCADWGQNNLICFGACHAVALYKPKGPSAIIATLHGHKDRVNAVQWIRQADGSAETELVSASLDKTLIVWKSSGSQYEVGCHLVGHTESVTAVDALYMAQQLLIVSASADCSLRIWLRRERSEGECSCIQTIALGRSLVLSLALVLIPTVTVPLLACGQDDQKIHLYVYKDNQFEQALTLCGHDQWPRSLSFAVDDSGDVLLASGSQDNYIRVWRISSHDGRLEADAVTDELKLKEDSFTVTSQGSKSHFAVTLESVLLGHEHWVCSVQWQPPTYTDGCRRQPLCLLSASMDKTMIVWRPHLESGIWMESMRVGEVGGGNLGFLGGLFSPDGQAVLAHGYQGAFHLWHYDKAHDTWRSGVTCGGHFGPVQDIVWGINAEFLLSISSDQTTRLHAVWASPSDKQDVAWHEIARPQIHGYDIQCIALVNRFCFSSGADEKMVRVFQAPKNFLRNFGRLCDGNVDEDLKKMDQQEMAEGASVPALGLSNKAVFTGGAAGCGHVTEDSHKNDQYSESYFTPQHLTAPPTEENLLQNTLWPETEKLYGHSNELFTVACSPDGSLLASACKATKPQQASIILWDTTTWRPQCRLHSHTLTVTQLAFSHSGQLLLSVSRDRTWSLFARRHVTSGDSDGALFERLCVSDKKSFVHSRIIWSCAWSHDDQYFITASRDKKAVVWSSSGNVCDVSGDQKANWKAFSIPLELEDCITAVDFAPVGLSTGRYLLAFGLETGSIVLYTWLSSANQDTDCWRRLCILTQSVAHHLAVRRVRFSPFSSPQSLQLASCSQDHAVKIYHVALDNLTKD